MIKDKIMFQYCTLIVKFHIVKIGVKYIFKNTTSNEIYFSWFGYLFKVCFKIYLFLNQ